MTAAVGESEMGEWKPADRERLKRVIDAAMIEWFERHYDSAYPVCYGPLPGIAFRDHLLAAIEDSDPPA